MNGSSVGLIELSSVAAGFTVADAMLKAGHVQLLLSRTICSGKYMVLVRGEASAVASAMDAGTAAAEGCLIDQTVLTNLHPDVLEAIGRTGPCEPGGALGVVESFNVASLVEAADAAVKAGDVRLLELRLAMALGGKAFALMAGDVAAVQASVAAAERVLGASGVLVKGAVIPRPHPDLYHEIL